MTQTCRIRKSVQNLRDADLITGYTLYTKVTCRQCALQAVFNRGGFDDFIHIRIVNDTEIILSRAPRAGIDFANDLFRHILYQLIEVVAEQVV